MIINFNNENLNFYAKDLTIMNNVVGRITFKNNKLENISFNRTTLINDGIIECLTIKIDYLKNSFISIFNFTELISGTFNITKFIFTSDIVLNPKNKNRFEGIEIIPFAPIIRKNFKSIKLNKKAK